MFRQPITWLSECFGGHTRPSPIGTQLPFKHTDPILILRLLPG